MCEQALVAAAKQGQAEAFGALCQPLARKLIHSAERITKNREDAEDALQNAFLNAFMHIKNFDGRSSFSTWLTRIAINSALMTLRSKRRSREIPIGFGESDANGVEDVPDFSADPENLCARREKERILREAICELRPTIRQAVEFQLRELSIRETAGMTGVSVTAAKGRLFHGRRALRAAFGLRTNRYRRRRSYFRRGGGTGRI
jgi:RNA polymerase sigma factor (sigma-70 family)